MLLLLRIIFLNGRQLLKGLRAQFGKVDSLNSDSNLMKTIPNNLPIFPLPPVFFTQMFTAAEISVWIYYLTNGVPSTMSGQY